MAHAPPRKVCLFCGGYPVTREHVLPDWLHDAMNLNGKNITMFSADTPIRTVPALDVVLRRVCAPCNNVWLNDIEGQFKERMKPALHGNLVQLDPAGQQAVAMWGVKTWLLLELALAKARGANPAAAMPLGFYRYLRRFNAPPPQIQVWLGWVNEEQRVLSWLATKPVKVGAQTVGLLAVFTLGRLLFQFYTRVVIGDAPAPEKVFRMELGSTLAQGLLPIAPDASGIVVWPPKLYFAISDLERYWMGEGHDEPPVLGSGESPDSN